MNATRITLMGVLAALVIGALAIAGCSKKTVDRLIPNIRPTVRLTAAPTDQSRATPYFYAYKMNWIGDDPDGRVSYFLYTVDPPSDPTAPIAWTRSVRNEQIVFFGADSSSGSTLQATRPHIFAICAVDDNGDTSDVVSRGFYSYTQCPTVTLASPTPNTFYAIQVTPSVRLQWNGNDPDGQLTSKPVKYKYILLGPGSDFSVEKAIATPDSLRNYYAYDWALHGLAGPWAGWDSTSADTSFVQFQNLTPEQTYLFVVIAFDEAGAFSPVFSLAQNMIRLKPGYASTLGPKLTIYNDFFYYAYKSGGWSPQNDIKLEVAAGTRIPFFWSAEPPDGSLIESYRWMLDGNPYDDTTRENDNDATHWSEPSLNITNITVGPFAGKTQHFLYIEALDNNGLRSLGVVNMTSVQATLERDLLIVHDVRIQSEATLPSGCLAAPTVNWPNAAELDTFLYARGNVPWQCVTPAGNSDPGVFNGYRFDVFRTRSIGTIDKTVRLDSLGKYRNVVWMIDSNAGLGAIALNAYGGTPSLRYMSSPGRVNTLGSYVRQQGRLWIVGGGGAIALCKDMFNSSNNDVYTFTYSNRLPTELQPGRFMYDVMHWRSELQVWATSNPQVKRSVRAEMIAAAPWSMPTYEGPKTAPDYLQLPAALSAKVSGTEPVPATRVNRQTTFFRPTVTYALEYLSQPNSVLEDVNPDPVLVTEKATLDTLMKTEASLAQGYRSYELGGVDPLTGLPRPGSVIGTPIMTYYHGLEFPPIVFSGHDIWNYRRDQVTQLTDFVLQRIFGLTKSTLPAGALRVSRAAPQVWTPNPGATRVSDASRRVVRGGATGTSSGSHD
jgi:hypothetical protein